ncbi:uncharacterized protein RHOBADRAFT_11107 [Rhodotorula graminis WP1]|uniref:Uncharacterized protein n=1 Tax=Rhodotorula graminis (strain WP1) TaxID=578459 RepID=A0A194SC85_RHOGW|nr:uncharacterized protein RHOBADRAFT_11107 [Rhodotorula graminis WP1]KPV78209.1 hypothetical protein RHOBADRAFT_11107 [Rhodotorula graminis WP1]
MAGAIVTAPFDVVKTRLQSDLFARVADTSTRTGLRALLYNFVDTGKILRSVPLARSSRPLPRHLPLATDEPSSPCSDVYKFEGAAALFKGLGPTLAGAVPARSINFFVYGNGKVLYADLFNHGQENTAVHLAAAATAGVATAAATNPIWVVKTDMQLRQQEHKAAKPTSSSSSSPRRPPPPPPAPKPHQQIYRVQGVRGFYRGLSASLLGVTEGTIQWSLYEQFKVLARVDSTRPDDPAAGASWRTSAAAGSAKLVATVITYPHEVVRTRLRQPIPHGGSARYTSLAQSFRRVLAEEGWRALYGGMSAHLLRVIPNAAAMFYVYETCVGFVARSQALRVVEENDLVVRE